MKLFSSIRNMVAARLGLRITLIVNFFVLLVMGVGTYLLATQANRHLETELLSRGKHLTMVGAKMFGTILEEAIDNGVLSVNDAFDTHYEPIGGFNPPKYHTKYDFYLDKAILKLQDEFLKDESILYALGTDVNGYAPTHNSRYQQPFTGNQERDKTGNRTKRLFNDTVGLNAAKNTTAGYLQIYPRDTGEVAWDVSSPIFVKSKHWGGFRVGISLAAVSSAKLKLSTTFLGIMICVLLTSITLTYLIVNRSLAPVKVLTDTADELAQGLYRENNISAHRQDEIGHLQRAMVNLRIEMQNSLNKQDPNS